METPPPPPKKETEEGEKWRMDEKKKSQKIEGNWSQPTWNEGRIHFKTRLSSIGR